MICCRLLVLKNWIGHLMYGWLYSGLFFKEKIKTQLPLWRWSYYDYLNLLQGNKIQVLVPSKNTTSCTLFGELVDCIFPFLERESSKPLIVIFQLFRLCIYKGNRSIQSSFYASNIHINPLITEVIDFKKKLLTFGSSESREIIHISS
ncbi:hypothetical protein Ahy_A09g044775 [Arachis hypogaea]|uniref:Uncharacterized protein n=1 Tax=Arachis hypogaea TaxID=3818 RepID=A0A445BKS1_ARAHY|nr:hypothetical protein Ahy_A09g044775 [Arachis hypogaea]